MSEIKTSDGHKIEVQPSLGGEGVSLVIRNYRTTALDLSWAEVAQLRAALLLGVTQADAEAASGNRHPANEG